MLQGTVTLTNASSAGTFSIVNGGTVNAPAGITATNTVTVNAGIFNGNINGNASVTTGSIDGVSITGTVTFGGNGSVTATTIDGQVDFAGNPGTINLNDTGQLAAVTNSSTTTLNIGTLNTLANGTITGPVTNIGAINIKGANGTTAIFQSDVTNVAAFSFTNTGTAEMGGDLVAQNVDFQNNAAILTFNGTTGPYVFSSPIENAGAAILNVYTTLTADNATIGDFNTINIGKNTAPQAFTIAVNQPALELLSGGSINFGDLDSSLTLQPGQAQAITFDGNIEGAGGGGDTINVDATNGDVTLQGKTGTETVGANNKLTAINILGSNTVTLLGGANQLNISGANALSIGAGSTFEDQSLTSSEIIAITIGAAGIGGAGTYILDAVNGDFNLSAGVTFGNPDSILQLQTSIPNGNSLITLNGDINPGAANTGIINIDSANAGAILTIAGAVNVGIAAPGNTVQQINFTGDGEIVMTAPTLNSASAITTSVANLTLGTISNGINFAGTTNLTIDKATGTIDFKGFAGKVNVTDKGSLAAVTNSSTTTLNVGTLVTQGNAAIAGPVNNINAISIDGPAGSTASFESDILATSLTFIDGGTANLSGSLGSLTSPTSVDFGAGGILEFSGTNAAGYTLNSPITNGENGILNVYTTGTTLTAIDSSVGELQTINIGDVNAPATFAIDVSQKGLTLESTINIGDPGSAFNLTTSVDQNVTFTNNIAGGGSTVNLSSTGKAILTLGGTAGTETLGTAGSTLAVLNVSGNVGIIGNNLNLGTKGIDVSNTAVLNIAPDAVFADASLTSTEIPTVNIGIDAKGVTGPAIYALDAVNGDFDLETKVVNFLDPSSVFRLMTSDATGKISKINLTTNIIAQQSTPQNNAGIVSLYAQNKGSALEILGEFSLGTADQPLKQINFEGDGAIAVGDIFTQSIKISIPELAIQTVNANVLYDSPLDPNSPPTEFATTTVVGNMDFQNIAGTAIFGTINNVPPSISGNIRSTGGQKGTVISKDDLTVGGTVTDLAMFKGGADGSTVTFNAPDPGNGVTMSVGEIQGTGTGNIIFAQATNLEGGVNLTGGTAVNLVFNNGGSISGDVGSNSPIGNVTIQDGTVNFSGKITGGTVFIADGAVADFDDDVNIAISGMASPRSFGARATFSPGLAKFDSKDPEISIKIIGEVAAVVVQIDGNDVTFNQTIDAISLNFTTTSAATATFTQASIIGGVTSTSNGIHTVDLAGNTTIGNSDIGSSSNTLKTILFTKDVTFTNNSPSVYSTVTSNAPDQGIIVYTADNGFTSDLGDSNNSLKVAQFSSIGGTVKGDTYAQNINIDSGKSAIFSGINSRSLSVPSSTVGGVSVPRSKPQFNYQTLVSSSNLKGADGTSSAEFTNAALVQAPINGGSYKFDNDVWLQKPVTGTNTITFAPKATALISANVGASNIIADQATLMFVGDNADIAVQGNISGSNITFDLGNNTVTYTGSATPTGTLVFNVFYDTQNAGHTGNTDSGNIVLANGATLDLSNVNSIQVVLNAQNNPGGITQGSAYPIITSTGDNIIVGNAANLPFNTTANENVFVRWVINNDSFILYPINVVTDHRILPTIPRVSGTVHNITDPILIIPGIIGTAPSNTGGGSGGNIGYSPSTPSTPLIGDNSPSIGTGGQSPAVNTGGGGNGGYSPTNPSTPLIGNNNPIGTGGQSPSIGTGGQSPAINTGGGSNGGYSPSVSTGGQSPAVNTGGGSPASTGVSPNATGGSTNNGMNPIGSGNDNSGAIGSRSPATVGASKINPSDGFNVAQDNTKAGVEEVNKRVKALKDEEDRGTAVAGGDCELDSNTGKDVQYGLWTTPYYSRAVQKAMSELSGYKSRSAGGSIGADTVINGNVLGIAYTRVDTKLRYQDDKIGNTTKVQTNMGSIYGLYRLINNFFVEGIVTYSRSKIKTNELRNIVEGFELAQGEYHSTSYGTMVIGGYSHMWNDNTLSPMAGLRLSKIKDSGYTEQGTTFQNLTVQKRQFNKVVGILGAELKTIFNKGEFSIRPQVHAFINYDFKGKTPAIVAKFDNTEATLPVTTSKATKMLYNLGAGVVVEKGRMEYAFHYGLTLAKKYHAQSGTLRLKVNF